MPTETLQTTLILSSLVLAVCLIYLITTGKIKKFSLNINNWFSVNAEGHAPIAANPSSTPLQTPDAPEPSILDQVQRFKRVMAAHGMRPEHWSRFFNACDAPFSIERIDQLNDESLLKWIDDDKIDWLCQTLLIRRDWMDGERNSGPHESFNFNKRPKHFLDTIEKQRKQHSEATSEESSKMIFALDSDKGEPENDPSVRLLLAVALPVCRLSDELTVYRWVYDGSGGYPWNDTPYNTHLRIIARLCFLYFSMFMFGLYLSKHDFRLIENGDTFFPEVLAKPGRHGIRWYPDDYALSPKESAVSKSPDDFPNLLKYMQAEGLPCSEERHILDHRKS